MSWENWNNKEQRTTFYNIIYCCNIIILEKFIDNYPLVHPSIRQSEQTKPVNLSVNS